MKKVFLYYILSFCIFNQPIPSYGIDSSSYIQIKIGTWQTDGKFLYDTFAGLKNDDSINIETNTKFIAAHKYCRDFAGDKFTFCHEDSLNIAIANDTILAPVSGSYNRTAYVNGKDPNLNNPPCAGFSNNTSNKDSPTIVISGGTATMSTTECDEVLPIACCRLIPTEDL